MDFFDILAATLLALGCFFILTGSIGALRMPDFYSRIHPVGQGDTMGQFLVLAGLMVHYGLSQASLKLLLIVAFLAITAPTATHAMARAAALAGLKPWQRKDKSA